MIYKGDQTSELILIFHEEASQKNSWRAPLSSSLCQEQCTYMGLHGGAESSVGTWFNPDLGLLFVCSSLSMCVSS